MISIPGNPNVKFGTHENYSWGGRGGARFDYWGPNYFYELGRAEERKWIIILCIVRNKIT